MQLRDRILECFAGNLLAEVHNLRLEIRELRAEVDDLQKEVRETRREFERLAVNFSTLTLQMADKADAGKLAQLSWRVDALAERVKYLQERLKEREKVPPAKQRRLF